MTLSRRHSRIRFAGILFALSLLWNPTRAAAGDDPSIPASLRAQIQASMKSFLQAQTVDGLILFYDPVENRLLRLQPKGVHSEVVKKADFYVSCADFVDQTGRKLDLDLLVRPAGDKVLTTQAVVHAVDGAKREYQLETR